MGSLEPRATGVGLALRWLEPESVGAILVLEWAWVGLLMWAQECWGWPNAGASLEPGGHWGWPSSGAGLEAQSLGTSLGSGAIRACLVLDFTEAGSVLGSEAKSSACFPLLPLSRGYLSSYCAAWG